MPSALLNPAIDIGKNIVETGMGLLLEKHNDRRQMNQQTKLQDLQIKGQQQMTDYNMAKQLQMWKDTNYGAQMQELEKAGLNPSLIYGTSGGGGVTTGSANGQVTGGHAPEGGQEIATQQAMGLQRELLQAQKENIQADTANKIAENPNITKTGENISADTKGKDLDNQLKEGAIQSRLQQIATQAAEEIQRLGILETQNKLDANTRLDKQLEIANKALLTGFQSTGQDIKNEQMRVEINALQQDIINGIEKIKQGWTGLNIQEKEMQIHKYLAEYTANHPELGKVLGGTIQRIAAAFGSPNNETKVSQ